MEYVEITGVAAEGKALAKVDNVVLFVPYAVPGDIVDVRVTRKKHRFMAVSYTHLTLPTT